MTARAASSSSSTARRPAAALALLGLSLGLAAAGGLAPGCNGTGTTPVCDFPDGASDPASGCGILIEASADGIAPPTEDAAGPGDAAPPSSPDASQASDATLPADAAHAGDAANLTDAQPHITDGAADAHQG